MKQQQNQCNFMTWRKTKSDLAVFLWGDFSINTQKHPIVVRHGLISTGIILKSSSRPGELRGSRGLHGCRGCTKNPPNAISAEFILTLGGNEFHGFQGEMFSQVSGKTCKQFNFRFKAHRIHPC